MINVLICFLSFILIFTSSPLMAARGGGGGGGRGGGGRTPSMSRSAPSRSVSSPAQRSQARPQAHRRVMSQSKTANRPSQPKRAEIPINSGGRTPSITQHQASPAVPRTQNQGNIRDVAKQHRSSKPFRGDISKVPQARQNNVRSALPQKFKAQHQTASRVGDNVRRNHPNHRDWFSPGFNARHDFTPHFDFHGNVWRRAAWNDVNSWLGYGWSNPYYYDYGYPVELTSSYESYYETEGVQGSLPSESEQWISLGVFVAGKDEVQAAYSNWFIQLALDRQGNIAGTYYNGTTDQTYALDGYVDQTTQEAFWRITGQSNTPLMSTGIFNLTQDVVPVTVAFSGSNEQNWVLVRVNE